MCRTRRRLAPEVRRAQLLDVGSRLFAQRPYEQVWVEEVAELAGVSRGLMYRYFPTKRDFFAAIVQRAADDLLAITEPDPDLPVGEQIAAGLDAYLARFEQGAHVVLAVNRGAMSGDEGVRAIVDEELRVQQRRIVEALGVDDPAVELAVRGWVLFVRGVCVDWIEHRTVSVDELRALCLRALDGVLGPVAPALELDPVQASPQAPARG